MLYIITGFGSCCVYIPSHVLSGLYYEKYRSFSTGVATSGSGLGGAVMPVVVEMLIAYYGWQGAFIVLSGLCLHTFVFSLLLIMPPSKTNVQETETMLYSPAKPGVDTSRYTDDLYDENDETNKDSGNQKISESFDSTHVEDFKNSEFLQLSENIGNIEKKCPNKSRHIYIFKSYSFDIMFLNNVLWNAGLGILMTFLPEFLTQEGLTDQEASLMWGCFGMGVFVGGILGAVVGNMKRVNREILYIISCLCLGILIVLFPNISITLVNIALILTIAGLTLGVLLGLLMVVLTDIIGIENLENGMGYLMFSNGLGTFIGPPIAGKTLCAL